MINLFLLFSLLLGLFAMIGYLRGWQKEVITLSGLVAVMALLQMFAFDIVSFLGFIPQEGATPEQLQDVRRSQIYLQVGFLVIVTFFSYQVVARLALQAARGRLGDRLRSGIERRIIGLLVGAINGYVVIGGLWGFLEYLPVPEGYAQMPAGVPYPFNPEIILRPVAETVAFTFTQYLPQGVFSPTLWLILFFVTFFIVIVALI
jgi:hypothetical protein